MLLYTAPMALCLVSVFLLVTLSYKNVSGREKMTAFECGMNLIGSQRTSFSLQFALLGLLFLLFDMEVVMILPIPISLMKNEWSVMIISIIIFILLISLLYEWYFNKIKWE